jgi:hypothetical protein
LGYLFGSQWELVSEFISSFGGLTLGLVILGAGLWLWTRRVRSRANMKQKISES